jgi:hypothetical protein
MVGSAARRDIVFVGARAHNICQSFISSEMINILEVARKAEKAVSDANSGKPIPPESKEEAMRNRIEGPIPDQTLAQFFNRAHAIAFVRQCPMEKETQAGERCLIHFTALQLYYNVMYSERTQVDLALVCHWGP